MVGDRRLDDGIVHFHVESDGFLRALDILVPEQRRGQRKGYFHKL